MSTKRAVRRGPRIVAGGTLLLALWVFHGQRAVEAQPTYLTAFEQGHPYAIGTKLDSCVLCHTSLTTHERNPFGAAFQAANHDFTAIEGPTDDADGDGWSNLDEIKSLSFPGDPADRPAVGEIRSTSRVISSALDSDLADNVATAVTVVANTMLGLNVNVLPLDARTGTSPVSVAFAAVTRAGTTSLVTGGAGPAAPPGFAAGRPAVFYELATTAAFSPPVTVCIRFAGTAFGDPSHVGLFHFEGGAWADRTVSVDPAAEMVCGRVMSFSPFAVFERTDFTPPTSTASSSPPPNDAGWNNGRGVTVDVAASDDPGGSGVAEIRFTLEGAQTGAGAVAGDHASLLVSAEGTTTLTYGAVDRLGNAEAARRVVVRLDRTPPVLAGLPTPGCALWPPSHRLVRVGMVMATDLLSGLAMRGPDIQVQSNEPELGLGDGDTAPDIVVEGGTIFLRAERSGRGMGRIYSITARATDRAGNTGMATATCLVPHDPGR
jgi:hypothetical protein